MDLNGVVIRFKHRKLPPPPVFTMKLSLLKAVWSPKSKQPCPVFFGCSGVLSSRTPLQVGGGSYKEAHVRFTYLSFNYGCPVLFKLSKPQLPHL